MRPSYQRIPAPLAGLTTITPAYLLVAAALAALVGTAGYFLTTRQWMEGLQVLGLSNQISWGLQITNFVFFVGLSAGGIIIAALAHLLGMKEFKPIARFAELLAIVCILLVPVFVIVNDGRPDRFYNLLIHGHWSSPLMWDFTVVFTYLVLAMAMGYFGTRRDLVRCMEAIPQRRSLYRLLALGYTDTSESALKRDERILKALSILAIPTAVGLHSITAWIMGLVKAKPLWHSTLLAPLFVASALVSGLALLVLALAFMRALKVEVRRETILKLGRLLLLLIPLLGYFLFSELLTVVYPGVPKETSVFADMMLGKFVAVFWFNLFVGLVAPLLILAYIWFSLQPALAVAPAPRRRLAFQAITALLAAVAIAAVGYSLQLERSVTLSVVPGAFNLSLAGRTIAVNLAAAALLVLLATRLSAVGATGLAAALVVVGVLAERFNVVVVPFFTPFLPYPRVPYVPTAPEIWIILGVYALGALVFVVLAKVFPLIEVEEERRERTTSP